MSMSMMRSLCAVAVVQLTVMTHVHAAIEGDAITSLPGWEGTSLGSGELLYI